MVATDTIKMYNFTISSPDVSVYNSKTNFDRDAVVFHSLNCANKAKGDMDLNP